MKLITRERAVELGHVEGEKGWGGGVWYAIEPTELNPIWVAFDDEDDCLRYAVIQGYHVAWVPFGVCLGEYLYQNGNY